MTNRLRSVARIRAAMILMPLILFMLLLACAKTNGTTGLPSGTDATLRAVVQAESDVDAGVAATLQVTEKLYAAGTVDKATALIITNVLAKVTAANADAIGVTKGLVNVDPTHRRLLQLVVVPIIKDLQDALNNGLVNIKDGNAKAAMSAALSGLLVTLQIIQSNTGGA